MKGLKKLSTKLSIMLIMVLLIPLAVPLTSFANNYVPKKIIELLYKGQGDKQTLAFNVSGKKSSTGIGYRTKGWWMQATVDGTTSSQEFYTDDQLAGESGDMVVHLPLYTGGEPDANGYIGVLDFLGLSLEDYHKTGELTVNAGQTVVVNGVEKITDYNKYSKKWEDIRDMVYDIAKVNWSSRTQHSDPFS